MTKVSSEEQSNNANVLLCAGFISVNDSLPKSENELNGTGSYYFSPKLMVIEGKRKYKATFQTAKKQFYRAGDNLGREDFGHLSPCCWRYL
jgi:hypothetical protein